MLAKLKRELLSGLTVSIVALPLALAFGIQATGDSSGAIIGMYGAIITGFFAAMFGGTPRQVTGPTGPITVIFTGVVAKYGLEGAFVAAFLGGLFQILFGVFKLGNYLRFIPLSVVSGFMNGIAIIIVLGQLKFVSGSTFAVAATILLMLTAMKWIKAIPASLFALLFGTVTVFLLERFMPPIQFSLPLIGDITFFGTIERIGTIPSGLPHLHIPFNSTGEFLSIIPAALSIAVLGSIDSLLTSVVMDNMTGTRHNSNKELIGQGIGNTIAGLFGAMPGAGATVRSVVNLRSGSETAMAAMVHSVCLLLFMLFFGPYASQIPLAVLAGILIITGVTMFDYGNLRQIGKVPFGDTAVMILTMILTVAVDLMVAVGIGIVLSSLLFMKKMSDEGVRINKQENEGIAAYTVTGPLFFGMADRLNTLIGKDVSPVIVLDLHGVELIDETGAQAIAQIHDKIAGRNQELYLIGINPAIKKRLEQMKITQKLGEYAVCEDIEAVKWQFQHSGKNFAAASSQ